MFGIIEIDHLKRRFGSCEAVDDLSLSVPEGSVFALLGPNGAGKTTTIKVMMNIIRPTAGSAQVLGVDSRRLGPAEFRQIGYVSENQELPAMTVRQLLDYCRPLYPSWDPDFAATLLKMLDVQAAWMQMVDADAWTERYLWSARAVVAARVVGPLSVFAGPTFNVFVDKEPQKIDPVGYGWKIGSDVRLWPGILAGLRLF